MPNLNVLVQQMIHAAGHRMIFRAPYYPVDSPIEHYFNTLQIALTDRMYSIVALAEQTNNVARNMSTTVKATFLACLRRTHSFARYFEHVGMT
jgi:hypothetical protein